MIRNLYRGSLFERLSSYWDRKFQLQNQLISKFCEKCLALAHVLQGKIKNSILKKSLENILLISYKLLIEKLSLDLNLSESSSSSSSDSEALDPDYASDEITDLETDLDESKTEYQWGIWIIVKTLRPLRNIKIEPWSWYWAI